MTTQNMIASLSQGNPLPLLLTLDQMAPQLLAQQIAEMPDNESYFIDILEHIRKPDQVAIYELFVKHGYDIKRERKDTYNYGWKNNKNDVSDYILAWSYGTDALLSKISKDVGKEYILQLEAQDFFLLHKAYEKSFLRTATVFHSFGLDVHKLNSSESSVLDVAKDNIDNMNHYLKSQNVSNENGYEYWNKWLDEEINAIKSDTRRYYVAEHSVKIQKFFTQKLNSYTQPQQETLIAKTVQIEGMSLFKHACAVYNTTPEKYEPQHVPVWAFFENSTSLQVLNYLMDKKVSLAAIDPISNTSFVEKLGVFLDKQSYIHGIYNSNNSSHTKKYKLQIRINELTDQGFWLTTHPQKNEPWFLTACRSKHLVKVFHQTWLNVQPLYIAQYYNEEDKQVLIETGKQHAKSKQKVSDYNPFTKTAHFEHNFTSTLAGKWFKDDNTNENNAHIVREILSKTWFFQDSKGIYAFEHYSKIVDIDDKVKLLNERRINNEFIVFTPQETMRLFQCILHQRADTVYENDKFFMALFNSLKEDKDTAWKHLKLSKKLYDKAHEKNTDIFREIDMYILQAELTYTKATSNKYKKI